MYSSVHRKAKFRFVCLLGSVVPSPQASFFEVLITKGIGDSVDEAGAYLKTSKSAQLMKKCGFERADTADCG